MTDEKIVYDLDGKLTITEALRELLNLYPGLPIGDEITFATLSDDGGKAIIPSPGAVIESEVEDITGHVEQTCLYPFAVVYRAAGLSESRKASVKEWLDDLGRWLEGQTVTINDVDYTLDDYPTVGSRDIIYISRQTPAYLDSVTEDRVEDWAIQLTTKYTNEFDR